MIRILVTNVKGGCGKTTIATNLAAAFAQAGLASVLADADRQRSSLGWLELRPAEAPRIGGLDWRKATEAPRDGTTRLVIDAPAALRMKETLDLLAEADLVVVPVLPSIFDEQSTERFLAKLHEVKPIRKHRKDVLVVANRLRTRSRAVQRLDTFLARLGEAPVARLGDRALYGEVATQGLSVFDLPGRAGAEIQAEWRPLLAAIDAAA